MKDFLNELKDSIQDSSELIAELGDTAIELAVDSDLISKVPILSWANQAYKIKNTYQLKKMQRNTKAFLEATNNGDAKKINIMLSKINEDQKYREEFIDNLLNILIDSEKPIKAKVTGNLLIALSEEHITKEEFDDLSLLLIRGTVPSLRELASFVNEYKQFSASSHRVEQEPFLLPLGICSRHGNLFRISNLGEKLYTYGLKFLEIT